MPSTEFKINVQNRSNNHHPGIENTKTKSTAYIDAMENIKSLRLKFTKNVTVGHLNINSIRNKIDNLRDLVNTNLDILTISESKLDSTFPKSNFSWMAERALQTEC